MTAEIAVLNQFGVALAADSAVSIGDKKVYNSANKLFALSKTQPVGILIYGNAKFMSAPWEVLIKYFRRNILKQNQFQTLDDYCDLFLNFIAGTSLIPKENEKDFVLSLAEAATRSVFQSIKRSIEEYLKKHKKIAKSTSIALTLNAIDDWLAKEKAEQARHPSTATKQQISNIRKEWTSDSSAEVSLVLSPLGVGKQRIKKVADAILDRLACQDFHIARSGLVIAGYGENDLYPSAISYEVSGRVCGFLRAVRKDKAEVGLRHRAWVTPFAQREMVDTFIGGIDPEFHRAINAGISKSLDRVASEILPKTGITLTTAQVSALEKELKSEAKNFRDGIGAVQQQDFAQPVLSSVAALPIDELAAMAEALVSLTSFKRKVTMVPESVGGPVDVAVISKGDGFIWIKRKHYFRPELNQHYLDNFSKS